MGVPTFQESRDNRTFILNSKLGSAVVPTNYVSLDSFVGLKETFYNKVLVRRL
ncbi:hypothetical protein LEP1GSC120_2454 [Leptospira santarosai str. 200702252]|nr:hypothetical protein LEP1GSC120_2454 [Leptospira santarosai str. 200702252]